MNGNFLDLVNISITASRIVLVVLVLRFVFKKAPKWINCLLWAIVGLRLVMPFSPESVFSLIPSTETIIFSDSQVRPSIQTGVRIVDNSVNEYLGSHYFEGVTVPANNFSDMMTVAGVIWIIGIIAMLAYGIISYLRLCRRVSVSIICRDNIFYCDDIDSPFILGIIKPKIYLPSGIAQEQMNYVIQHEKAHLKRKDHLWKPLAFSLLTVYWFNPVIWVAYIFLCRDIELACDEKAIKDMDNNDKKGYSEALMTCSVQRRMVLVCPLAFGEVGVRDRIKSVLSYKKPAFWIVIVAVAACVITSVCFLTNPVEDDLLYLIRDGYTTHNDVDVLITELSVGDESSHLVMEWDNPTGKNIEYGEEFHLYRKVLGIKTDCRENKNSGWNANLNTVMGTFAERTIILSNYDLAKKGNYVLEFDFTVDGDDATYTAYLEFSAGIDNISLATVGGTDGPENVTIEAVDALKKVSSVFRASDCKRT